MTSLSFEELNFSGVGQEDKVEVHFEMERTNFLLVFIVFAAKSFAKVVDFKDCGKLIG